MVALPPVPRRLAVGHVGVPARGAAEASSRRADTMALSQEIKILAFTNPKVRCLEMPIYYGERVGESKLNLWRDGFGNLLPALQAPHDARLAPARSARR